MYAGGCSFKHVCMHSAPRLVGRRTLILRISTVIIKQADGIFTATHVAQQVPVVVCLSYRPLGGLPFVPTRRWALAG